MDLLLDMVSSLGGEDFCFEKINPSMAVSTSGKALGSLPGLGIALLRKDIAEALVKNESHDHYFAFAEYLLARSQHRSTPFTPPVHLYPPLLRALQLIKEEGLKHKLDRHAAGISILENIAALHGFKPIGVESPSKTTRTFAYDPCDHSLFDDFKRHLLAFGFVPLQNPISQRSKGIFQLSSMGYLPVPLLRRLEQSIAGHSLIAL